MAKRRKEKDEEEDKPFKIPKFDEEAFLKKERRNIKASFLSFLFGLLMALICFGFWALMGKEFGLRWVLILLVAFANAIFLRQIFLRLKVDLTDFGRKNWFGSYAIYFFTWLIVLIVLVNPPFYDDELPRVETAILPVVQEPGGDIIVVSKITDNVGIDKSSLSLDITDPDGNKTLLTPSSYDHDDIIVIFTFKNSENKLGDFDYVLTVKDVNGQEIKKSGTFKYEKSTIEITSSRFINISSGDDIRIEVNEDISPENFRVYYKLDDGEEINANRKYEKEKAEYETSPEYKGWEENSNFSMTLFVEVSHYFSNVLEKYGNIVEHTEEYEFTTTQGSNIGDEDPPVPWNWTKPYNKNREENLLNYDKYNNQKNINSQVLLPYPKTVQAPGFEAIVFLISLAAVILIFKYRKKNRSNQK